MPARKRRPTKEAPPSPPPVIEPAPEPPLTLEHMCRVATRNRHVVFQGSWDFECSVNYAAGCKNCGAYAAWDDETHTTLHGVFVGVYDKPCSVLQT
jgi:hypothetical protein